MHDIKLIRKDPEAFDAAMVRRGLAPIAQEILENDLKKRENITDLQQLKEESNKLAKKIGELKANGQDADKEIAESKKLKAKIASLKNEEENTDDVSNDLLNDLLLTLPNILADDVPDGEDDSDNKEVRKWGEPKKFDFKPKEHSEIGGNLGMMDFEQTAKISGSRFVTLSGKLSRMERALTNFMLDIHTKEFGYKEVSPPLLVRSDALVGTSQLPKFSEDLFRTTDDFWLIPTSEVPITNIVREKILDDEKLPIRMTAFTPCFRSEAGAAGQDTHGMIRQHQFSKVELVSIAKASESEEELERKTKAAEEILKRLELPYRVMMLCSNDTGFASRKTYDIEVFLPGQNKYREISSCSLCGDFQARRMNTRSRAKGEKETNFVHTLNGSGLAIGRTIIAILENYQNEDGSVIIPHAQRPYMDGEELITKD